jgi:hypothetical protein
VRGGEFGEQILPCQALFPISVQWRYDGGWGKVRLGGFVLVIIKCLIYNGLHRYLGSFFQIARLHLLGRGGEFEGFSIP